MSIKQTAQQVANDYFKELASEDDKISASQLAQLVNRDAKTVRARLRKIAARDQEQFKNANWRITKTLAASELAHYMTRDAQTAEEEEVEDAS